MKKILPKQYAKILYNLTRNFEDQKKIDNIIKFFVLFLKKNRSLSKIDFIIREFEKLSKSKEGIMEMEIKTAHSVDNIILQNINNLFGVKQDINLKIDKSIGSGIIIKTDDFILDGSLKTQLLKLKKYLVNN